MITHAFLAFGHYDRTTEARLRKRELFWLTGSGSQYTIVWKPNTRSQSTPSIINIGYGWSTLQQIKKKMWISFFNFRGKTRRRDEVIRKDCRPWLPMASCLNISSLYRLLCYEVFVCFAFFVLFCSLISYLKYMNYNGLLCRKIYIGFLFKSLYYLLQHKSVILKVNKNYLLHQIAFPYMSLFWGDSIK